MYDFRFAELSDRLEIEEFLLKYYLFDEPLNRAANIRDVDFKPVMKVILDRCLQDELSVVCRCKVSGNLVGVLLCSLWLRDEEPEAYYDTSTRTDIVAAAHDEVTNIVHDSFWKMVDPTVHRVLHREMSSVAREHQRKGIGSTMQKYYMNRNLVKRYNVDGMVSETSSVANQRLLDKEGFQTLLTLHYNEWKDKDGNFLLKTVDGSTKMELKWKPLREDLFDELIQPIKA